jgi:hypothetical protein
MMLGQKPTKLSDVVEYSRQQGFDPACWHIDDTSAPLYSREDAFALAREWHPELIDDEQD